MKQLTAEHRERSHYLGDGLYVLDHGIQLELFATDGIMISNSVYLDDDVQDAFLKYLENKEEIKKNKN